MCEVCYKRFKHKKYCPVCLLAYKTQESNLPDNMRSCASCQHSVSELILSLWVLLTNLPLAQRFTSRVTRAFQGQIRHMYALLVARSSVCSSLCLAWRRKKEQCHWRKKGNSQLGLVPGIFLFSFFLSTRSVDNVYFSVVAGSTLTLSADRGRVRPNFCGTDKEK